MKSDSQTKRLNRTARRLATLAVPNRLRILCLIMNSRKVCVSDIATRLGLSVAIVSHHLKALAAVHILKPDREGRRVCYLLEKGFVDGYLGNFVCRELGVRKASL